MLQEPGTSPYDWHFHLLGFPVRVTWAFWLVAAILGWGWSGYVDSIPIMDSPGAPVLLLVWICAVFISILVHELGHTFAMRHYGINSRVVLYHFGGLAIPDSFGSWNGARQRSVGPREQIVISAAGPAIQLALGVGAWCIAIAMGIRLDETSFLNRLLGTSIAADATYPQSAVVFAMFSSLIWTSLAWSILNLAPILPLDGGHITRSALLLTRVNQPDRTAYLVSIVTAALLGLWFLSMNHPGGIMFLLFAASNWQAMQHGSPGF